MSKRNRFSRLSPAVILVCAGITRAASQTATIINVPTLDPNGAGNVYPQAINASGEITGLFFTQVSNEGNITKAFVGQAGANSVTEQDIGYAGGSLPLTGGPYDGNMSYNFAINGAGVTAGGGMPADGSLYTLTEYNGKPMTDLGTIPLNLNGSSGPQFPSFAASISSTGIVAGASLVTGPGSDGINRYVHAVVNVPGHGLTDLSAGTTDMSVAYSINPQGTMAVGFDSSVQPSDDDGDATTGKVATLWTRSGSTWTQSSLGTLGGAQSIAYSINAAGQVVGISQNANGGVDPFLRQANGTMIDLAPTPAGSNQVLGNPIPGCGFANPTISPIAGNLLNSALRANACADAINDLGQIVGYSGGATSPRAYVETVDSNGTVSRIDLNTLLPTSLQSVWTLREATGINDQGQIVGWGINKNINGGGETGFVLDLNPIQTWNSSTGGSWTNASNWQGNIPNGSAVVATFGAAPGLTLSDTVTLDGSQTVGHVVFNNAAANYTLSQGSGGSLIIDDSADPVGPTASITVSAGNHTINAPIVLATNNGSAGVTVNTWGGASLTINGTVTALNNGAGTLTVNGAGTLFVGANASILVPVIANSSLVFNAGNNASGPIAVHTVSSITLGTTSSVAVAPALTHASRQLLITNPIFTATMIDAADGSGSIPGWAGQIDLANNDMDVPNGNLANLTLQVSEGYDSGAWDGLNFNQGFNSSQTILRNGIISSTAAADPTHLTALGVIQNQNSSGGRLYATFDGQSVQSTDVLIKFTYCGDANLDGVVNSADYALIDNAYLNEQSTGTAVTGWYAGDFNYDGIVNGSDYTLIDNAFNTQGASLASVVSPAASLTAQIAGSGPTSVPEPATLGMLTFACASLLGRRKK